jgi:hypothetical protein
MARFVRWVEEFPAPTWAKVSVGVGLIVALAYAGQPGAKPAGHDKFSHERPQALRGERIRNLEEERKLVQAKGLPPPSPLEGKERSS